MGYVNAHSLSAAGHSREDASLAAGTDISAFRRGGRPDGGTLRRFEAVAPHADRAQAALPANSLAVIEARTVFPSTVVDADIAGRVLVSGHNNPKLGRRVTRGIWAGMPIFHLTLEERATCPHECHVWRECYGNAMHQARRHRQGPALVRRLGADLCAIALEHPSGFVVRLHTLGDFYSVEYASRWAVWLGMHPELRVFGFTAHPADGVIGGFLRHMNAQHPDRCAIRFSRAVPTGAGMEATTIWRQPEAPVVPEGIVCPAQTGAQECCGTCGMCWARGARGKAIVFVGHGMKRRGPGAAPPQRKPETQPVADPWPEGELERRLNQPPPKGWTDEQWNTVCYSVARGESYRTAARAANLSPSQVIGIAHRRNFPAREDPIGRVRTKEERQRSYVRAAREGYGARGLEEARARSLNRIAEPLPTAKRDAVAALEGVFPAPDARSWEAPVGGALSPDCQFVAEPDGSATAPPGSHEHARRVLAGKARSEAAPAVLRHATQPKVKVIYRACRWPIGEPCIEAFRFCDAADVIDGKPYCGAHCALAYIPRGRGAA